MQIEIRPKDRLTEDQQQALKGLSRAVYPPDAVATTAASASKPQIQWAPTTWSVLIWGDQANLVSYVGALTRQAKYNDKAVLLGGIGSVKTHPKARGRGYAGAGIVRASEFLRGKCEVAFSLLVCREELLVYYQRFGWQHFTGDVFVEQPSGRTKFTFNEPMVLSGGEEAPLNGVLDLCGMPW